MLPTPLWAGHVTPPPLPALSPPHHDRDEHNTSQQGEEVQEKCPGKVFARRPRAELWENRTHEARRDEMRCVLLVYRCVLDVFGRVLLGFGFAERANLGICV